ncbi:Uncharacterised protein [Mycobacterium tuberculosis]|uniref:Uncharacterized protein n=1 Tax=Mycobacterium tuberculosis TaxID=1773 RepID=A0A0U0S3W7_MYCTX|nr:Uncharacterised protein [Mycobacterium tuberculosis]CKR72789.1 Uncharacterised protein [Mycobacterium tuberculosis]CKS51168.1 Uncharacterised protein [Mycobacterium tuberculosis]CKS81618.1 Uncharacterised protein [Mycobacterium tuberculosis]CKU07577.1 Uncharacterised protein [Mycobacterium tuberculosis]
MARSHLLWLPSSVVAPVSAGCALNSAPVIPSHPPGPTPPGTWTVPPSRIVWIASNTTKASTSSR